jgi:hypothetical protein
LGIFSVDNRALWAVSLHGYVGISGREERAKSADEREQISDQGAVQKDYDDFSAHIYDAIDIRQFGITIAPLDLFSILLLHPNSEANADVGDQRKACEQPAKNDLLPGYVHGTTSAIRDNIWAIPLVAQAEMSFYSVSGRMFRALGALLGE